MTLELAWPYEPRWYQERFEEAMFSGKLHAVLTWHRRTGKDIACFNYMLHQAIHETKGTYFYVFPTYSQGRKAIWDAITEDGVRFLDFIPKKLLANLSKQEMKIDLSNGSYIQILGSMDFDKVRGTNPKGVVFSEYAYQSPKMYEAVFAPILAKNKGWVVFNSTPQGRNHHYEMVQKARIFQDTWYESTLTIEDTKLLSAADIQKIQDEGRMSNELIQQEFYCSFEMGVQGSIFGSYIQNAIKGGRIGTIEYDINFPVYTAFDLGYSDSTVVIWFQRRGDSILVIDHIDDHHRPLSYYFNEIVTRKYRYAGHFLPHDGRAHNIVIGVSPVQAAIDFGLQNVGIVPRGDLNTGIETVRRIFPRLYIDAKKCEFLVKCLLQYHYEWDDKRQAPHNKPSHDWSSHSCDALRTLAMCLDLDDPTKTTKEDIDKYWRESLGLKDDGLFDKPGWNKL